MFGLVFLYIKWVHYLPVSFLPFPLPSFFPSLMFCHELLCSLVPYFDSILFGSILTQCGVLLLCFVLFQKEVVGAVFPENDFCIFIKLASYKTLGLHLLSELLSFFFFLFVCWFLFWKNRSPLLSPVGRDLDSQRLLCISLSSLGLPWSFWYVSLPRLKFPLTQSNTNLDVAPRISYRYDWST